MKAQLEIFTMLIVLMKDSYGSERRSTQFKDVKTVDSS